MRRVVLLVCLMSALAPAASGDERARYPGGESVHRIEGLSTVLYVPKAIDARRPASLVVLLHGARAKAANLATFFRYWPHENYVICAPQATGPVWTPPDLVRVRRIVKHLQQALPLDSRKTHVCGFSNGAGNLHTVAFADDVKARSGTWVGMGYRGGALPAWAKTGFAALFMVGGKDRFASAARESIPALRDQVRSIELIVDPDVGHTWPTSQLEYHLWWTGVMEGRFTPGDDHNFDWDDDLDEALATAKRKRTGVLLQVFDPAADAASEDARFLQTRALMDARVRELGRRLEPVMLERSDPRLAARGIRIEGTPTVVVLGADGKPVQRFSGRIGAEPLVQALSAVARR